MINKNNTQEEKIYSDEQKPNSIKQSFKLYRFTAAQDKKLIGYFQNEAELIDFFNNPYEIYLWLGYTFNKKFETLQDIEVYIARDNGGYLILEKLENKN